MVYVSKPPAAYSAKSPGTGEGRAKSILPDWRLTGKCDFSIFVSSKGTHISVLHNTPTPSAPPLCRETSHLKEKHT